MPRALTVVVEVAPEPHPDDVQTFDLAISDVLRGLAVDPVEDFEAKEVTHRGPQAAFDLVTRETDAGICQAVAGAVRWAAHQLELVGVHAVVRLLVWDRNTPFAHVERTDFLT